MTTAAAEALARHSDGAAPRIGLVLGSGLGALAEEVEGAERHSFTVLPGFPVSSVSGHAGELVLGTLEGVRVALVSGRVHAYEGGGPAVMRPVIETLRDIGVSDLLLTNSAGSTREDWGPGTLVALSDHINFAGMNPLTGEETDARFLSMVDAYDPGLRARLGGVPEGVYAWFSGPSFETPAEIRAIRTLGADLVGMSTVPECILARFFGMRVAAVSVVTNLAAGMTGQALSHDETKQEAAKAQARFRALVKDFVRSFA
ncbi:purine-nucleoside phosphorylase (plasmid) [Paroceanicella profunda]|uniref:Purine nucleoside phosphorylase n=1 Tax=Paroceanicella profunda TaxID=2579971 RepID=A0A5B8FIT1_9RHOB|nr:purine-nucleoside phosphorylase [Paroceanicella profunda]QDL94151.1 purine-nucleoside phosphorylase [Paroceanicella profunda]